MTEPGQPFVFLRATDDGYQVLDSQGHQQRQVSFPGRTWVSGISPDLTAYYMVEFPAPDHVVLRITHGTETVVAYQGPWNRMDRATTPKVTWARRDGDAAFILARGELTLWARCSASPPAVVLRDLGTFAATQTRLYWVRLDSPTILRWREWQGGREGTATVPFDVHRMWAGADDGSVVVARGDSELIDEFATVDASGAATKRPLPTGHRVLGADSVEGGSELILRTWDGQENRDGTEAAEFALWNYASGSWRTLMKDPGGYEPHVLDPLVSRADLQGYAACLAGR